MKVILAGKGLTLPLLMVNYAKYTEVKCFNEHIRVVVNFQVRKNDCITKMDGLYIPV